MKAETMMNALPIKYNEADMRAFIATLDRIIAVLRPEKIICYGCRVHKTEYWSSFKSRQEVVTRSDFDLLFVMAVEDQHDWEALREIITENTNDKVRIIPIGHGIEYVSQALQKGSRFFSSLYHNGVMLYDSTVPLAFPPPWHNINNTEIPMIMEKHLKDLFKRAKVEMDLLPEALMHKERELAVYILQLCTRYAGIAIIWAYTGYTPQTDNLKEILELTEHVTNQAVAVFPGGTKEEKYILDTLTNAYRPKHYKQYYQVTVKTITLMQERVAQLQAIAKRLCVDKLNAVQSEINLNYYVDEGIALGD